MNSYQYKIYTVWLFCALQLLTACDKKKEFLDERTSSIIFTPETISDLQALLDNEIYLNEMPEIGVLSADEYYLGDGFWETLPQKERNCYVWEKDIFQGQGKVQDWNLPYKQVLYANIVLDRLEQGVTGDATREELENIEGAAKFVRGLAFFNLAVNFAATYDINDAGKPGIPVRLRPEMDQASKRATLQETYNQIISDIRDAARLLPDSLPQQYRNRPCKAAAFGILGRVYLSMRDYSKAADAADSSLKYYNRLIDYNTVNAAAILPFVSLNIETIYQAKLPGNSRVLIGISTPACMVDSALFDLYETNDLRKQVYFFINSENRPNIKGGYSGSIFTFAGLAVDEVLLIKAEAYTRTNRVAAAMETLNTLLRKRYRTGTYADKTASGAEDAIAIVLEERRKELVFRGLRWMDLKRLNKSGAAITITRKLNNQLHTLSPDDPRYILPIPPDVLALGGIEPNYR